ncbi:MAG: hypothetical protein HZB51_04620 [Chloroflexi bacterium]|nr:hypothetical protein [Chloroflexota bacterium]
MDRSLIDGNNPDAPRELLSEIDAGELDERYLIKHARDYGRRGTSSVSSTVLAFIRQWMNWRSWVMKRPRIDPSIQVVSHSVQQR